MIKLDDTKSDDTISNQNGDALSLSDDLFYDQLSLSQAIKMTDDALMGLEDGELYLQYKRSESLLLEDGRIKSANYDIAKGFGLRGVEGEQVGYFHGDEISPAALKRAKDTVKSLAHGYQGVMTAPPSLTNRQLYQPNDPLEMTNFVDKVKLLDEMDKYARGLDHRVEQVSASIAMEWSAMQIIRSGGFRVGDIRPLIRVNVSIVVNDKGRRETGSYGCGGRGNVRQYLTEQSWHGQIDEALRQALVNLDSVPAPAGEMVVVLGSGWPGILLHEAVGHGLEGDFNRKKSSAFSDMMGKQVAAKGVTVIDDATIEDRRGSLTIDDEGTAGEKTVLIEDGILKNYLHDRQNARLMGMAPTGNGRRQSYAHIPMPRMTNTYMNNGQYEAEEIIKSVDKGIYAVNFGGGQVDITNGKFVFSCTEAYRLENGKIGAPLKGATLIGNGPDALTKVSMIGNDSRLDPGIGTCGKNGQGVPVGVGQPTIRMDGLTVGGTAVD